MRSSSLEEMKQNTKHQYDLQRLTKEKQIQDLRLIYSVWQEKLESSLNSLKLSYSYTVTQRARRFAELYRGLAALYEEEAGVLEDEEEDS